jgi:hypothetical protein
MAPYVFFLDVGGEIKSVKAEANEGVFIQMY